MLQVSKQAELGPEDIARHTEDVVAQASRHRRAESTRRDAQLMGRYGSVQAEDGKRFVLVCATPTFV